MFLQDKNGHEALQKTRSVDWFANMFHIHKVLPVMMMMVMMIGMMLMMIMIIITRGRH